MCKPGSTWGRSLSLPRRAQLELISAMSSLNMYPEPNIEAGIPSYNDDTPEYISVLDANVAHAMEHLHEVLTVLEKIGEQHVYLFTLTYGRSTPGREPGELFAAECFQGTVIEAREALADFIGKNLNQNYTGTGYKDRADEAMTWARHLGFGVFVRRPMEREHAAL